MRHDLGLDRKEALEVGDAIPVGAQRLVVLEVADVVPDPRPAALDEAESALELRAAAEHLALAVDRQLDALGHVAARAAEQERPPPRAERHGARDGVVRARLDRAVVQQEEVRDRPEACERLVVLVGDRLVGHVAARHHERGTGVREQQVVKRGVGEHQAELAGAGSDRWRDGRACTARRQHDRPLGAQQQLPLVGLEHGEAGGLVEVAHHQGERLLFAVLARAQRRHGVLVVRPAGEVKPADALDRHDRARRQAPAPPPRPHRPPAGGQGLPVAVDQRRHGPAIRACDRLRVKPAIARVLVFRTALLRTSRSRPSS